MNPLIPRKIHTPKPYLLRLEWADGFAATITTEELRKACPCAHCKGETIMGRMVVAPALTTFKPGMYEIEGINPVGNYAIQVGWRDGHNTGIYPWELLREVAADKALDDAQLDKLHAREQTEHSTNGAS